MGKKGVDSWQGKCLAPKIIEMLRVVGVPHPIFIIEMLHVVGVPCEYLLLKCFVL